jgi:hypothetical protein
MAGAPKIARHLLYCWYWIRRFTSAGYNRQVGSSDNSIDRLTVGAVRQSGGVPSPFTILSRTPSGDPWTFLEFQMLVNAFWCILWRGFCHCLMLVYAFLRIQNSDKTDYSVVNNCQYTVWLGGYRRELQYAKINQCQVLYQKWDLKATVCSSHFQRRSGCSPVVLTLNRFLGL